MGGPVSQGVGGPVGERGIEWFAPSTSGTIYSNDQLRSMMRGGGSDKAPTINNNEFHFHGVTDADSFRKSQSQIAEDLLAMMSRGQRNG